jgi:hypothetical protein
LPEEVLLEEFTYMKSIFLFFLFIIIFFCNLYLCVPSNALAPTNFNIKNLSEESKIVLVKSFLDEKYGELTKLFNTNKSEYAKRGYKAKRWIDIEKDVFDEFCKYVNKIKLFDNLNDFEKIVFIINIFKTKSPENIRFLCMLEKYLLKDDIELISLPFNLRELEQLIELLKEMKQDIKVNCLKYDKFCLYLKKCLNYVIQSGSKEYLKIFWNKIGYNYLFFEKYEDMQININDDFEILSEILKGFVLEYGFILDTQTLFKVIKFDLENVKHLNLLFELIEISCKNYSYLHDVRYWLGKDRSILFKKLVKADSDIQEMKAKAKAKAENYLRIFFKSKYWAEKQEELYQLESIRYEKGAWEYESAINIIKMLLKAGKIKKEKLKEICRQFFKGRSIFLALIPEIFSLYELDNKGDLQFTLEVLEVAIENNCVKEFLENLYKLRLDFKNDLHKTFIREISTIFINNKEYSQDFFDNFIYFSGCFSHKKQIIEEIVEDILLEKKVTIRIERKEDGVVNKIFIKREGQEEEIELNKLFEETNWAFICFPKEIINLFNKKISEKFFIFYNYFLDQAKRTFQFKEDKISLFLYLIDYELAVPWNMLIRGEYQIIDKYFLKKDKVFSESDKLLEDKYAIFRSFIPKEFSPLELEKRKLGLLMEAWKEVSNSRIRYEKKDIDSRYSYFSSKQIKQQREIVRVPDVHGVLNQIMLGLKELKICVFKGNYIYFHKTELREIKDEQEIDNCYEEGELIVLPEMEFQDPKNKVVFLGDIIENGSDSELCIYLMLYLMRKQKDEGRDNLKFLAGNHELNLFLTGNSMSEAYTVKNITQYREVFYKAVQEDLIQATNAEALVFDSHSFPSKEFIEGMKQELDDERLMGLLGYSNETKVQIEIALKYFLKKHEDLKRLIEYEKRKTELEKIVKESSYKENLKIMIDYINHAFKVYLKDIYEDKEWKKISQKSSVEVYEYLLKKKVSCLLADIEEDPFIWKSLKEKFKDSFEGKNISIFWARAFVPTFDSILDSYAIFKDNYAEPLLSIQKAYGHNLKKGRFFGSESFQALNSVEIPYSNCFDGGVYKSRDKSVVIIEQTDGRLKQISATVNSTEESKDKVELLKLDETKTKIKTKEDLIHIIMMADSMNKKVFQNRMKKLLGSYSFYDGELIRSVNFTLEQIKELNEKFKRKESFIHSSFFSAGPSIEKVYSEKQRSKNNTILIVGGDFKGSFEVESIGIISATQEIILLPFMEFEIVSIEQEKKDNVIGGVLNKIKLKLKNPKDFISFKGFETMLTSQLFIPDSDSLEEQVSELRKSA